MSETEGKSLEQKVDEIRSEPVTAKDKVIGIVIAVVFILSSCALFHALKRVPVLVRVCADA